MIKNWIKYIHQKNVFAKTAILLAFFAFSTACTDQGCIEADDFGEYESQTIEVSANSAQDSCPYDATKELSDSAQGQTLITCFNTGSKSVSDETGVTKTNSPNTSGCKGFTDIKFKNLCIDACLQDCLLNSSSNSGSAEPRWTSTDKRSSSVNLGVTIRPGSQITVTASGDISLGDNLEYPSVYVKNDNYLPHTSENDSSWSKLFFDARNGQTLNIKFSGKWFDGSQYMGVNGNNGLSNAGDSATDIQIYNGARRLVAFLVPHPAGYDFDTTKSTEEEGSKGVPLLPDARGWKCTYSPSGDSKESTCISNISGGSTYNSFYSGVSNEAAAATFPVSSSIKTNILSTYGGMVRWSDALLQPNSYDPFASVPACDLSSDCVLPSSISADMGRFIGFAGMSSETTIPNPSSEYSYKVSFKNVSSIPACNTATLRIKVTDATGNTLDTGAPGIGGIGNDGASITYRTINLVSGSWTSDHVSLEPGQKLVIAALGAPLSPACSRGIAVRFGRYHDVQIQQSGFISFATLGAVSSGTYSGNCLIKGRIINPTGSFSNATFSSTGSLTGYTADFYEHDNFLETSSTDPLAGLIVPPYLSDGSAINWSEDVFVRKGQKIRFSPESWDRTFTTTNSQTRECGVGMAMKIIPRPALLCRGTSTNASLELISNPACTLDYSAGTTDSSGAVVIAAGTLLGCKGYSADCYDGGNPSASPVVSPGASYCPSSACQKAVTCTTNGSSTNNYQKTGCSSGTVGDTCVYPDDGTISDATCNSCSNAMLIAANLPAKIPVAGMNQCYDLENYTGKVTNIPSTNGFSTTDLGDVKKSKGAMKLGGFNGSYGNFQNFFDTKTYDSIGSNRIFQSSNPTTFSKAGRLRFFVLDGNTFNGTTGAKTAYSTGNSPTSASYGASSGTNGFKISLSGMLSFSNGQWLEAKLCQEANNTDTSITCSNTSVTAMSGAPGMVEFVTPTVAGAAPVTNSTSLYNFDPYGNLIRVGSYNGTIDCNLNDHGVETKAGAYFYCHTYQYFSESDLNSKSDSAKSGINSNIQRLRLSFKIFDPEIANCHIPTSTSDTGTNLNGIKVKNSFYNPAATDNTGHICGDSGGNGSITPGTATNQCQKEFYCGNKYSNNSGKYYVHVKVKSAVSNGTSSFIGSVIAPVIEVMDGPKRNCSTTGGITNNGSKTKNPSYDSATLANVGATCGAGQGPDSCTKQYYCKEARVGQAERVYKLLIADPRYKAIVSMTMIMMFSFYGVGFLMGISELNHSEIINRIIKIGVIYLFIGETGWDWFNMLVVNFFKNSTDYLAFLMASSFDTSPELKSAINNSDFYDKSVLFSSVDKVFSMFFSDAVLKKVYALLFASIFGWAYLLIIIFAFMLYVYAVANAVLLYLTAQVFISILFTLGPIFFIFTLFNQTKEMFDNWLKQLIGFSLQQIFLLTTLAFFNMLMYEVIKMSLGYKICWDEVWTINILIRITLLSAWTIASLPPRTNAQSEVGNIGNPEGIPSLFSILFIWVVASLMNKFIGFMTDLAAGISGGLKASEMGSGIAKAVADIKKNAGAAASKAWEKSGGKEMMQKMDQKLFDSGALADKAREDKKAQNKKDKKMNKALDKAGDKAVNDLKKSAAYGKMDDAAKKEAIDKTRSDAVNKEGKKLGLKQDDIDKLQNDKGLKITSSNVFGAGLEVASQVASGKAFRSSADKAGAAGTSVSSSQAREAMKGMSKSERAEYRANTTVDRSAAGKALKAGGDTRKAAIKGMAKTASAVASAGKSVAKGAAAVNESRKAGTMLKDSKAAASKSLNSAGEAMQSAAEGVKDAAIGGMSAAGKAMADPVGTAKAAASAASSAAVNASEAAMDMANGEGYMEAVKELQKEGVIDRMASGMEGLRDNDDEKALIKKRQKANAAQKKADKPKMDEGGSMDAELDEQYMNAIEDLEGATLGDQIKGRIGAAFNRNNPFSSKKAEARENAKTNAKSSAENKVQTSIANANEEKGELEEARDVITAELDDVATAKAEHAETPEAKAREEEMKDLAEAAEKTHSFSERMSDPKLKAEDKIARAAKRKLDEMKKEGDPALKELNERGKKASAALHQVDSQIKNVDSRINSLKDFAKKEGLNIEPKKPTAPEGGTDPVNPKTKDEEDQVNNDDGDETVTRTDGPQGDEEEEEYEDDFEEEEDDSEEGDSDEDTTNDDEDEIPEEDDEDDTTEEDDEDDTTEEDDDSSTSSSNAESTSNSQSSTNESTNSANSSKKSAPKGTKKPKLPTTGNAGAGGSVSVDSNSSQSSENIGNQTPNRSQVINEQETDLNKPLEEDEFSEEVKSENPEVNTKDQDQDDDAVNEKDLDVEDLDVEDLEEDDYEDEDEDEDEDDDYKDDDFSDTSDVNSSESSEVITKDEKLKETEDWLNGDEDDKK